MKPFLYRTSFKNRIWLYFVVLIILAITISGVTSYNIASRVIKSNTLELNQNTLNKSGQALEEKFRKTTVSALSLMLSHSFQKMVDDVSVMNSNSYYVHLSSLQNPFSQVKFNELFIHSILISTPIGEFFPTSDYRQSGVGFKDTPLYDVMKESNSRSLWTGVHEDQLFAGKNEVTSLILESISVPAVKDVYVIVNIRISDIQDFLLRNLERNGGSLLILTESNELVLSTDKALRLLVDDASFVRQVSENGGSFEYRYNNTDYLVNTAMLALPTGWKIINLQSKSELLNQIHSIKSSTLLIMGICVLLAIYFAHLLTGHLFKPLKKFQQLMRKVENNDLSVRFESDYEDEFAHVGRRFNRMLIQIDTLIREVKEAEKDKRYAEIKALQAQINPHFLYNTLNTILWKSEADKQEDVREMIISLSLLFRLGLNEGYELTPLKREIEYAVQYLSLQQQCYENLFQYELEVVDDTISTLPVLKLLLQPLIENSILHGFKDMESGGLIRIIARYNNGYLHLIVEDNGKGMDVERVYSDLKETGEPMQKRGYALRNVFHRIKLYYGETANLMLQSESYHLTSVHLSFPVSINAGLPAAEQDRVEPNR